METLRDINKQIKLCIKCSNKINSYLDATAYSIICYNCATVYENYNGDFQKNNVLKKISDKPVIPIGSEGILKKIKYIVIAFVYKKEVGTNYFWHEYTLYNPVFGCVYLSMYNGHWTLLKEIFENPVVYGRDADFLGNGYRLYSKYDAKTEAAAGEFLFRFSAGETPRVSEYISPPYVITSEKTDTHLTWYKGEYIEPGEIKEGFNTGALPEKVDIGQLQSFVGKFKLETFKWTLIVLALIWSVLQFYFIATCKEELVFDDHYTVTDSTNGKDIYTKPFTLSHGTKNVEVKLHADIDNNWMYTAITIVNEVTGDIYDLDLEAAYYHGYEDGESWAEGASWISKVASAIPEGKYYMIIHPQKPANMLIVNLGITVTRDVFVLSNGLLLLLTLAVFPVYYFSRLRKFERKRWYNSYYSPYEND